MKILQVSHSFYPCCRAGGVVKVVYEISRGLVKRGHDVTVITTDGCTTRLVIKKNTEVDTKGIHVWYFQNVSNYMKIKFKLATPYLFPIFLSKKIKTFDIIHIHEHRTVLAIITSYYAKKYRIPYIIQAHGSVLPFYEKIKFKKIFDCIWGNKILRDASKCIALTKNEAEQYFEMGIPNNKIEFIPNGINLSEYADLPSRGQFRLKYQIPENERIILSLGRIHTIKGIDLLVEAFSQLCCEMRNVKLVIAGPDGGTLSQIQKQIQELQLENDVIFTGPLYGKDKLETYIDADIFVLPSRYEIFGITILEAWACKTPVIVTKGCLIADVVEKAGYVTAFDAIELKNALKHLLNDEVLRKKIGDAGKKLVESEFDNCRMTQKIESLYQKTKEGT